MTMELCMLNDVLFSRFDAVLRVWQTNGEVDTIYVIRIVHSRTRKRRNCEWIATWGRPSHASPFPL